MADAEDEGGGGGVDPRLETILQYTMQTLKVSADRKGFLGSVGWTLTTYSLIVATLW